MRKIKFRQPRIAKGKFHHWHYWGYVDDNKGHFVAPLPPNTGGDSYQYTGLKDKNGKEIYERDIVRLDTPTNPDFPTRTKTIIFNLQFAQFCVEPCTSIRGWKSVEIIGDIHTTPKLLEKSK